MTIDIYKCRHSTADVVSHIHQAWDLLVIQMQRIFSAFSSFSAILKDCWPCFLILFCCQLPRWSRISALRNCFWAWPFSGSFSATFWDFVSALETQRIWDGFVAPKKNVFLLFRKNPVNNSYLPDQAWFQQRHYFYRAPWYSMKCEKATCAMTSTLMTSILTYNKNGTTIVAFIVIYWFA